MNIFKAGLIAAASIGLVILANNNKDKLSKLKSLIAKKVKESGYKHIIEPEKLSTP